MVNYSNGKIYKIEPIVEHEEGEIYIGSTTKQYLSQRMDKHRSTYKYWKEGKTNNFSVFELFDKYGVDNCTILLLESVNVNSKDELLAREGHYIKTLKCVNKCIVGRTEKEWREDNKEIIVKHKKEWYESNKDMLLEKYKQYYEDNKVKILETNKEYRENNRDVMIEYLKQYRTKNKQKISDSCKIRINCDVCKCDVLKCQFVRHCKSIKHQNNQIN